MPGLTRPWSPLLKDAPLRFPAPIAVPLLAAGLACAAGQAAHATTLVVAVNHSVRLPVAGRAASVVVGNAAVADVSVVDSHTVFVTGKSAGSTDVSVVDPLGRTVYAADVAVGAGGGAPVTVHRAGVTSEMACDPRCAAPGQPKATGMTALMQDIAEMSAAKAGAVPPIASTPTALPGALPFAGAPSAFPPTSR